jgi:ketosteroid isomerase-like protein
MPAQLSPRQLVERLLHAAVSGRPEDMADCYASGLVIEMPFAPAGLYPARTETTREELRARFKAGSAVRRYERPANVVIHETTDPEVVIAEYDLHGRLLESGETFVMSFVMVITVREGLIVHTRDYTDPIAGARALGRLPELLTALQP